MATKVTLRKKSISQGRYSLYLDYYPPIRIKETMKMKQKEYLGIYIFQNPKNEIEQQYNDEVLVKAEGIRSKRVISLINEEYDFLDKEKMKGDFLAYYKQYTFKKNPKWKTVYDHFSKFVSGYCTFEQVTVPLCLKFRDYLLNASYLDNPNRVIGQNSAAGYFSTFRGMLKIAYKNKMLRENINDFLERIECLDTKKEFLIHDELLMLVDTPCDEPVLKQASLFACLTGLRRSDIIALRWEDIYQASEGGYCVRIRIEKGEAQETLPISEEALEICGERTEGKVFKGLTAIMADKPLKKWLKEAGITKKITFHSFRHTYATLQIAFGTDIYTVSKMLAHKHVETTEIYAKLVDQKKRDTVDKIKLKKES